MTILPMRIDISLNVSRQEFNLLVEQNQHDFSVDTAEAINVNTVDLPEYEGPYEVTPKVDDQTLETKDKWMSDNVHVKEIPYYETSNIQNGLTVFIANSIDD